MVAAKNKATYQSEHGYQVSVNVTFEKLDLKKFQALIILGGVACPDRLRRYKSVINFVIKMDRENELIASICHGAWS